MSVSFLALKHLQSIERKSAAWPDFSGGESEHPSQAAIGMLHVERITVRLWL